MEGGENGTAAHPMDACSSEDGGKDPPPSDSGATGPSKAGLATHPDSSPPSVLSPATEAPGGVALKVATTVLHPLCLGDGPLMLPIHLQMAGAAGPQLSSMGAAPYLITSQSPVSLPLVLDQQVLQHVSPSVVPQGAACAPLPLQSSTLGQNPLQNPLPLGFPPPVDAKAAGPLQDANLLALLQNPAFAAILQDLFPPQAGSSTCQAPGSSFCPLPPLTPPYTSPLAPLVPPATLLVPYPVIIPLPVPLPIPLPIPVPVPQTEDSKGDMPKPVCTVSRSTQTAAKDTTSPPPPSSRRCLPPLQPQDPSPSSLEDEHVLDLSVRPCPVEPKQECCSPQQDRVLDLSVPGVRRKSTQSDRPVSFQSDRPVSFQSDRPVSFQSDRPVSFQSDRPVSFQSDRPVSFQSGPDSSSAALSLGVDCTQSLDSKLLGSLASLEFSRQHKWLVDTSGAGSSSLGQEASLSGAGNLEIVSTSQTAKVIVSVKDAIPAILCGKIKGLSGVSTKNFSIRRDGSPGASLGQLYGVPSGSHREQQDPNSPHKKVSKNRAIKLKKVSSQEIHFLPIKKQRLAALLPRK